LTNSASQIARPISVGDVYCFRTEPLSVFSPRETGRFGILKILAADKKRIVWTILDGAFTDAPTFEMASLLGMIVVNEYDWSRRYATFGVSPNEDNKLEAFSWLGVAAVSAGEIESSNGCTGWTTWLTASHMAEYYWRSRYDADLLNDELEREKQAVASSPSGSPRRSKGDWKSIAENQPFPDWSGQPHLPIEFVAGARAEVTRVVAVLRNLNSKVTAADVQKELKACVRWFNEADVQACGVIETEEREDILVMLSDIAVATGHPEAFEVACALTEW
jgi:hypothetical protein